MLSEVGLNLGGGEAQSVTMRSDPQNGRPKVGGDASSHDLKLLRRGPARVGTSHSRDGNPGPANAIDFFRNKGNFGRVCRDFDGSRLGLDDTILPMR